MPDAENLPDKFHAPDRRPGDPGAIARQDVIHIDARSGPFSDPERQQPASRAKFAKCGNCMDKIRLTGDAEEDHHTAMRHKDVCRFTTNPADAADVEDERRQLIEEHHAQPMQTAYREAARSGLSPADWSRRFLPAAKTPVRWWQFWRRFAD